MVKNLKAELQIFAILLFSILMLTTLSLVSGNNLAPQTIAAKEPEEYTPTPMIKAQDTLARFGLPRVRANIGMTSVSYNLGILKTTDVTSVTSGSLVTFTITITNSGTNDAIYPEFFDDYPSEIINVTYMFSTDAISDLNTKPAWLFPTPIAGGGGTVMVTITGILTSANSGIIQNTAIVTGFQNFDTNQANNSSSASVNVVGYNPIPPIYLPLVSKYPTPTPRPITLVYHEDFSNDNWPEFTTNSCKTDHGGGRYIVEIDSKDKSCFPPAKNQNNPQSPYRTYGEFEVLAYQDGDKTGKGALGIFINGAGGDNYYLFRIWPDDNCGSPTGGNWQLIRKKSGNTTILKSGTCNKNIYNGYGSTKANILKITHETNGTISVYVNNALLGSVPDSNKLTGTSVGIYVRSTNKDLRMKFDNFKVYKY